MATKKIVHIVALSAVMCACALVPSCSSNPKNAIVGMWQEIDGTETMEFFKDGTVNVVDQGMSMAGQYSFIDKDRIKLELGGIGALAGPIIARVSVSENELTLTSPDGEVSRYRKLPDSGKVGESKESSKAEEKLEGGKT